MWTCRKQGVFFHENWGAWQIENVWFGLEVCSPSAKVWKKAIKAKNIFLSPLGIGRPKLRRLYNTRKPEYFCHSSIKRKTLSKLFTSLRKGPKVVFLCIAMDLHSSIVPYRQAGSVVPYYYYFFNKFYIITSDRATAWWWSQEQMWIVDNDDRRRHCRALHHHSTDTHTHTHTQTHAIVIKPGKTSRSPHG
jgi:hypothetical protein